MSIAVHPTGKYVATGEIGPTPLISIWDVNNPLETIITFNKPLTKGIAQLAFSQTGKYLAASAMEDSHSIAIFSCNFNQKPGSKTPPVALIATGKGTPNVIMGLLFDPSESQLVGVCVKEVLFVTFPNNVI